jgi:aerobic C4-dicarboxylate transport protein
MQDVSSSGDALIAPPRKLPWYRKLGMQVVLALVLGIIVGFVTWNK